MFKLPTRRRQTPARNASFLEITVCKTQAQNPEAHFCARRTWLTSHLGLLHPDPTPQQTSKPTSRLIISIKVILGLERWLRVLTVCTALSEYQSSVPRRSQSPVTPALGHPMLTSALHGHLHTDNSTHRHTRVQIKKKF